jgi:hypothetical protein
MTNGSSAPRGSHSSRSSTSTMASRSESAHSMTRASRSTIQHSGTRCARKNRGFLTRSCLALLGERISAARSRQRTSLHLWRGVPLGGDDEYVGLDDRSRRQLAMLPELESFDLAQLADRAGVSQRTVLSGGEPMMRSLAMREKAPELVHESGDRLQRGKQWKPVPRGQWDRILLTPDIELHIRRPQSREQNRQIERLM